ncbi:hypothetical protein K501DRAFT_336986, partial [Backusella circina FSU 941]
MTDSDNSDNNNRNNNSIDNGVDNSSNNNNGNNDSNSVHNSDNNDDNNDDNNSVNSSEYLYLLEHKLLDDIEALKEDKALVNVLRLIPLAHRGENLAIYGIGEEYARQRIYSKAMEWYEFASERQYSPAMYEIGILYQHGTGFPVDYFLSLEWFINAAKGNHKDACYNIGLQFEFGWGVSVDIPRAMEWFYKYDNESTNLKNLIKEGHPLTDEQKEKNLKSMTFEAEMILKIEELQQEKKQLRGEITSIRETSYSMRKDINLINGRVTLLRDENKVIWDELEKGKTETAKKVEGLERHVEQLVQLLCNQKITVQKTNDV